MTEIRLKEPDEDLIPLLRSCSNEELDNLVGYIVKKGGVASQLKSTLAFRKYHPNHQLYADEIAAEIQKFGGNTILNILRGGRGITYKEIVCNVAGRLRVDFSKDQDTDAIEQQILLKVLEKSWEKLKTSEKKAFLKGIMAETRVGALPREFPMALIQTALIGGGVYASYRLSLIVANAISRTMLERGITIIADLALSRWVAIFAGAVGWGITATWALFDVAGPAYRVIVPCVLHTAMLRQLHRLKAGPGPAIAVSPPGLESHMDEQTEILFRKF